MRIRLTAVVAAILITAIAPTAPAAAADDGSTAQAGECSILLADSTGRVGDRASIVFGEVLTIHGEGFMPNGQGKLEILYLEEDQLTTRDVRFTADGRLLMTWSFRSGVDGADGARRITLRQDDPACAATATIRILPFEDVLDSKFLGDIKWVFLQHISSGCPNPVPDWEPQFCPDGLVTRGQMATFLVRALKLPPTTIDYFTDDEGNIHEDRINRLRAAGITFGCGPTTFCPKGLVTRAQMASFLARAFKLPSTSTDWFTDDEGNRHEANINRLRSAGITFGCGGRSFCPDGIVTRGQMAAFLHRAME